MLEADLVFVMRRNPSFDFDTGMLAALVAAIYASAVCGVRGLIPGRISGLELAVLVAGFAAFAMIVGVIARISSVRSTRSSVLLNTPPTTGNLPSTGMRVLDVWSLLEMIPPSSTV